LNVVIIIPTYNEEGHIRETLKLLEHEISHIEKHTFDMLVFDSNSSDKTIPYVKSLQADFKNIHLLVEEKKSGLGGAYIKAMRYVMENLDADVVFEFDADGSHQPKYIPKMMLLLEQGADVVIGSRYVAGGKIDANWAWNRRMISLMGNGIARLFLTRKFHDITSGFRATKVNILKTVSLENLLSKNYAYKIHLLWELHLRTAAIVEVPITFLEREYGFSKFPRNNIWESLKVVIMLRLRKMGWLLDPYCKP
jgi:dolichol-phosphate mannosyltransferase